MWRRGLDPWLRRDLPFEQRVKLVNERREKEEVEMPPIRYRTVYEIVEDDVFGPFARHFIAEYFVCLENCERASRLGFVMDSWSKRNGKSPREITRFLSVHEPFNHIEVKLSYLRNARCATANGCYGIRGLVIEWDLAIWGLLREIESVPYANPFAFPNCAQLSRIIGDLRFRPEASPVSRAICRASVAVQYAMSILYSYDHAASMTRYLRSLVQELAELNDRLAHVTVTSDLRIEENDYLLIYDILSERVAQRLGIPFNRKKIYMTDGYYEQIEAAVEAVFDRLCECPECVTRRVERVATARARAQGLPAQTDCLLRGKNKRKKRNRFFEENHVALAFCPDLGRLRLPRIRHLDLVQQDLLCRHIGRDLMFDSIFGVCRSMSRIRGVPIPFCSADKLNLDLAYLLYIASNVYFLAFLIKHVREVLRVEERSYTQLVVALVRDAARLLRADIDARVAAGAEPPLRAEIADVRDPGLSDEERDLGIVNILEGLSFQGVDVSERVLAPGNVLPQYFGGFCRDAALYMEAVAAHRVPRALREHRARGEAVAHVLGIKRMYEDRPLSDFHGDALVPYHLFVGGHWRRDACNIRGHNVTLMDDEIAWFDPDDGGITGHVSFYDRFEELNIIREVVSKKRTFMMELQRMYVSKSELIADAAAGGVRCICEPTHVVEAGRSGEDDDDYEGQDEDEELTLQQLNDEAFARVMMYSRRSLSPGRIQNGVDEDDDVMYSESDDGDSSDDGGADALGARYVIERLDDLPTQN